MPYKRPQITRVLESLVEHESIRDVNSTTKRLVQRCLSGEWCKEHRSKASSDKGGQRVNSPGMDAMSVTSAPHAMTSRNAFVPPNHDKTSGKGKALKTSRSVENMKTRPANVHRHRTAAQLGENLRLGSNDSSSSLPHVASAAVPPGQGNKKKDRGGHGSHHNQTSSAPNSATTTRKGTAFDIALTYATDTTSSEKPHQYPHDYAYGPPFDSPTSTIKNSPTIKVFPVSAPPPIPSSASDTTTSSSTSNSGGRGVKTRRAAPPPPPGGKRKPPAPPTRDHIFGVGQGSLRTSGGTKR